MTGARDASPAGARDTPAAPSADPVAALCREHGYPPEVRALLDEAVGIVAPLGPLSVLLHGSASRGELTWWRDEAGRVQLGSDLEMYVVGRGPADPGAWAGAARALAAVEERVNREGPRLFHLDVGWVTRDWFRRHPRTFRCWDTRETGRTLLGADVRDELPALDAGSIDLRQLNEVPIHRLWEMAFRVPAAVVRGGGTAGEVQTARYTWARQALDLTTWLLPHAGVMVPTFRRRVQAWHAAVTRPPLAAYFAPDSAGLLEACLEGKLHLRFRHAPAELHARVLDAFRAGLRMLLGLSPGAPDAAIGQAVLAQGAAHWHGEPPRRRVYEAFLLLRGGAVLRPGVALPWWLRRKRPHQVAFLLHLNAALAALLAGGEAGAQLDAAEAALRRLWFGFAPRGGSGTDRFLAARRGYVDYLVGSSRWFGPRRAYLYSVLEEPCGPA
ncbi:MAG TPA: hypothetical protein VGC13_32695 [Longimicrobium sp.]|uniref:hypothetical protein n=1 Tax=Longimicrobium sp. TaxID=2029185 RepID=UPI002EDAFCC9